jgi:LacI family transcriptional regulator
MAKNKLNRVSLKDIADKVGVSTALVSYVLNGLARKKRVGAETAERIHRELKEMNYVPNYIARSLRNGTTKTIGLIVADIANPFFSSLARFIEDEASKFGYTVFIGSSDEDCDKAGILVRTLLNRQVDGFIIIPADGCYDYLSLLIQDEIPLVMVDRYIPELSSNYVVLDNYRASYDATIHLIDKGFDNIGMISFKSSLIHMMERVRGYEEAMRVNGFEKNIWIKAIRFDHLRQDMDKAISSAYKDGKKMKALLFATNTLSIAGLYKIQQLKLNIPADLAIIGFDGNEAFDLFYSPLTYIKQPVGEMGKEAVRILIEQINGSKKISHINLQPQLVKRESCG